MPNQDLTPLPKIEFYEAGGRIHFRTVESGYHAHGSIPSNVAENGDEAVLAYAKDSVSKQIARKIAATKKIRDFQNNPNFPIEFAYGDVVLTGRITSAGRVFEVELISPLQGSDFVNYGFGSPQQFTEDLAFTGAAVAQARKMLIGIYKNAIRREKYKAVIDRTKRLNTLHDLSQLHDTTVSDTDD